MRLVRSEGREMVGWRLADVRSTLASSIWVLPVAALRTGVRPGCEAPAETGWVSPAAPFSVAAGGLVPGNRPGRARTRTRSAAAPAQANDSRGRRRTAAGDGVGEARLRGRDSQRSRSAGECGPGT